LQEHPLASFEILQDHSLGLATRALQTCRPVIFNVGEIVPQGRFYASRGDFVIYGICGGISVYRGAISVD